MQLKILDLGLIPFDKAYQIQKETFQDIKAKRNPHALILCEHYPVITLGRKGKLDNILADAKILESAGVEVRNVDRGGDITYHGPGQLVVYPIINLSGIKKDINDFLRRIEQIIIDCLKDFNINSSVKKGLTGVWVDKEKIASIGIGIRQWITFHGLAINVNTDLDHFSFIKPCGLDIKMTSMKKILHKTIDMAKCKHIIIDKFKAYF